MELSHEITRNILKQDQNRFLTEQHLMADYSRSGKDFNYFVNECLDKGDLKVYDVDQFLLECLFYGYHRETYIYNVSKQKGSKTNADNILEIIRGKYSYVSDLKFNELMKRVSHREELVVVDAVFGQDLKCVSKLKFIFKKGIQVITKQGDVEMLSYIPIEWDLINGTIIVKIAPRRRLVDKNMRPECLNKYFVEVLRKMFDFDIFPFGNTHKQAICDMSKALYAQVYQKMVVEKPQGLDDLVDEMAEKLRKNLGVEALELKQTVNNIFNISDNLHKQVENILISDIILGFEQGADLEGVEGVVTYLKFNDGKLISARLKGKDCHEPIFDSEAYMALRSAIENMHEVSKLVVIWLDKFDRLRVSYDATDCECLNIHFYKDLSKEEFEYGLQMYKKYEYGGAGKGFKVFELEVQTQSM